MEGSSSQQMHVQVGNGLTRLFAAIDDQTVTLLREPLFAGDPHRRRHDAPPELGIVQRSRCRHVDPGNDQNVLGGLGVDVAKRHHLVVLKEELSFTPLHDVTEETPAHSDTPLF